MAAAAGIFLARRWLDNSGLLPGKIKGNLE